VNNKPTWLTPCNLRTNRHFTRDIKRIARIHVNDYLACYQPGDHDNTIATWTKACPNGRWNS
jgi:type I restriction enzyme M protein